ncbi:MAG: hypothetical protein ABIB79_04100 [archaeon]
MPILDPEIINQNPIRVGIRKDNNYYTSIYANPKFTKTIWVEI